MASILLLLPIPGIILISSMWFWVWSLFMGTVAPSRYLIPLIPVVSLSVGFGITKIASKLKVSSNHLALILGMFSLSQSLFLSWHIGVFMLGYPKVKQLSAASLTSTQSIKEEGKMNLYSSIIALNSTDNNYFKYKAETIAISVAVFAISIAFVKVIAKFKYRDATFALIAIASLLPYAYVIFKVSEGHPIKFAKYEQEKIYNYWGLVNHVMPAINQRSVPNAKIVIYGPHVPVSYKLGLESINIDSGFGIKKLAPILFEKDQIAALQFLKQNKFDFFLLDAHTESVIKFEKLKSTFPVFSIFENPIYFEKIITPTTETAWFLYIIRQ